MHIEILWAGIDRFHERVKMDALAQSLPNLKGHFYGNLISALAALKSQTFTGVYVGNLCLPLCEIEPLSRRKEVFTKLNYLESSEKYGNGIYLARYSFENKLPILVSTSENIERGAAAKAGAVVCFNEDLKGLEKKFRQVFKI